MERIFTNDSNISGANNQKWTYTNLGGGQARLTNVYSGKVLEVGSYSNSNGEMFKSGNGLIIIIRSGILTSIQARIRYMRLKI